MYEVNLKYHPEVYRLFPFFENKECVNIINSLSYWNKQIPKGKELILRKIRKQCEDILNDLLPLTNYGLYFSVYLSGGAVRDFLLNKENNIKDLDIFVSLDLYRMKNIPSYKKFLLNKDFDLEKPELQKVLYKNDNEKFKVWSNLKLISNNKRKVDLYHHNKKLVFFDILTVALSQNNNLLDYYPPDIMLIENNKKKIVKSFENSKEIDPSYLNTKILGIIKLNNPKWEWPVDVICSDKSIIEILSYFDFTVCKVAIELINVNNIYEQNYIYPNNNKDFLKKIHYSYDFLNAVKNQELLLDVNRNMKLEDIVISLKNHYPRLKEKYNWKLKYDFAFNKGQDEVIIDDYLKSFLFKSKLENLLPEKKGDRLISKI